MKLKKIASLALAGIMAVSMLAGCNFGEGSSSSSSSSSSEPVVDSSLAGQIIAKLDSATTENVTFSVAGSQLSSTLEKAIKAAGADTTFTTGFATNVVNTNPSLGKTAALAYTSGTTNDTGTDSKVQKLVFVRVLTSGANEEAAAINLAAQLDAVTPGAKNSGDTNGSLEWNKLPLKSDFDNSNDQDAEYYWSFKYTAEVAATKVVNAADGTVDYVVAVQVVRTPTKVEL